MKRLARSVFGNSGFWGGALAGALVALLVLGGGNAVAQGGGDVRPSNGAVEADRPVAEPADPATPTVGDDMFAAEAQPLAARATIATAITYQGVLQYEGGPADGTFDLAFRLFDDPTAGVQVGEVISTPTVVRNGLFTVPLDFGAGAFSSEAVWLEIAVSPEGTDTFETLSPRQAITAAPLALGLPNVSTDPATGRVSIGDGAPLSTFEVLGIKRDLEDWVGMYIVGGGPASRPFYGYATDDGPGRTWAWTEYNGTAGEWRLYTMSGNVFTVSQAGDVHGSGSFSQPLSADGLVKAAAEVECWELAGFAQVTRSFKNLPGPAVTVEPGPAQGQCFVDFGFDLSNRFFNVTAVWPDLPRGVTCAVDATNTQRLHCIRWRPRLNDPGAEGWGGSIMITIY
jgi:hypothetical protein